MRLSRLPSLSWLVDVLLWKHQGATYWSPSARCLYFLGYFPFSFFFFTLSLRSLSDHIGPVHVRPPESTPCPHGSLALAVVGSIINVFPVFMCCLFISHVYDAVWWVCVWHVCVSPSLHHEQTNSFITVSQFDVSMSLLWWWKPKRNQTSVTMDTSYHADVF